MPKTSFFDQQPQEIIDLVNKLSLTHTASEITKHLASIGVVGATNNIINHFRQKHGLSNGYREHIEPAETFAERLLQYINMIKAHDGNEFTNKYLGAPGNVWSPCSTKLRNAGIIERIDERHPAHYKQVCSDEYMYDWYSSQILECK